METKRAREGEGPVRRLPGDAVHDGRLAAAVFVELQKLGDHLSRPGRLQPFAVVAGDGRVVAANRPLLELLGCEGSDLLGSRWARTMPAWNDRAHSGGPYQFDARLYPPRRHGVQASVPAHAWVHPVADCRGVVAHTLLLTPYPGGDG